MCAGIWMQVELHKYLELNAEYSYIAPYALVGMGAFIFMVGILACCCIVKGHPTLLYLVSKLSRLFYVKMFAFFRIIAESSAFF